MSGTVKKKESEAAPEKEKELPVIEKGKMTRQETNAMGAANFAKKPSRIRKGLMIPPGRPKSWLTAFKSDYDVGLDDVRKMCQGVIFGRSMTDIEKLAKEGKNDLPVIVYIFIKAFIKDVKEGRSDTLDRILDRVYGKSIQKEVILQATANVENGTVDERAMKLAKLEEELSNLSGETPIKEGDIDATIVEKETI
jgi:hypothetical protein